MQSQRKRPVSSARWVNPRVIRRGRARTAALRTSDPLGREDAGYADNLDLSGPRNASRSGHDTPPEVPGSTTLFVKRNSPTTLNAAFNGTALNRRCNPRATPAVLGCANH